MGSDHKLPILGPLFFRKELSVRQEQPRQYDEDESKVELPPEPTTWSRKKAVSKLDDEENGKNPENVPCPLFSSPEWYGSDAHVQNTHRKHEVSKLPRNRAYVVRYTRDSSRNLVRGQARRTFR